MEQAEETYIDRYQVTANWQTRIKCARCQGKFKQSDFYCVVNSGDITRCWFHPECVPMQYQLSQIEIAITPSMCTPDLFGGPVKA